MVRVGCAQDGVDYGDLGDTEVVLSQKHMVGDKGNGRLFGQSLCSSLKLETLWESGLVFHDATILLPAV